jgi:hypothetical protein
MLEDQAFRIMLSESTCRKPKFKLAQPLLFGLSNILYQIEPHMETIGYEGPLLFFDQCGVIALQDGLIMNFSHDEPVWDMRW